MIEQAIENIKFYDKTKENELQCLRRDNFKLIVKNDTSVISNSKQGEAEIMKGITKRSDGRFMVRKTINGKRIVKYAKTITQAKDILRKIKNAKFNPHDKITKTITLQDYADEWFEIYKKPFVNARTFAESKSLVNRFLKLLGNLPIKDITSNDIQKFFNTISISRTKEKIFTYCKAIFQKAFETNIINKNPFVAVIKDKKIKCKNETFTFEQQTKILSAIKGTDIEHEILIYLMCGCRPNELPDKSCFDFENNFINIYGTKNDNAKHRIVEMSENFANYIKEYFISKNTLEEKYVSNRFIKICKDIGIEKPILYRLRHTFASNHFALGTPAKQVQQWLGHGNISITLDQYTDIDKTATKQKIIKLYNNYYFIK